MLNVPLRLILGQEYRVCVSVLGVGHHGVVPSPLAWQAKADAAFANPARNPEREC